MTTNTLTINYTDTTKSSIQIPLGGINTSTPLSLYGLGTTNYGADLWANMLHLMENFCNSTPPSNPVIGQLFYKSTTKTLQLYTGLNASGLANWVTLITIDPASTTGNAFATYLPLAGGTITGDLILTTEFTNINTVKPGLNENRAATIRYVDSLLAGFSLQNTTAITNTVKQATDLPFIYTGSTATLAQRTMGAPLKLPSEGYGSDGRLLVTSVTTPTNELFAATRKYVDAKVATIIPGVANTVTTATLSAEIKKLTDLPFVYNNILVGEVSSRIASMTMKSDLILPAYATGTSAKVSYVNHAATRAYVDDSIYGLSTTITSYIDTNMPDMSALLYGSQITSNQNISHTSYLDPLLLLSVTGVAQCSIYPKPATATADERIYYYALIPFSDILPQSVTFSHHKYSVQADFADIDLVPYGRQPYSNSFLYKKLNTSLIIYLLVAPTTTALATAFVPTAFSFTINGTK
jgi:hypothetical protein